MVQIFGGMIFGSMVTMVLLGGVSASDQILDTIQKLYLEQLNRPNTTTTLLLMGILSILISILTLWPSQKATQTKSIIKNLRRHCS